MGLASYQARVNRLGAIRDTEALAAFAHVLLVGLSFYSRDGASEEQLRRVSDLALTVIRE